MDDKFLIAEKYAQGLFSYAEEYNLVERIMEDLLVLREGIKLVPDLIYWLSVPIIAREEKMRFISELCQKLDFCDPIRWFLEIVISKKRVKFLPLMIERYRLHYNVYHHRLDVKVVSAKPLTDSQRQLFLHIWGTYLKRWVNLHEEVDPNLIAGVKVYFEGNLYDATIKKRLELLKEELVR